MAMDTDRERLLAEADIYRLLSLSFSYPGRETMEGLRQLAGDLGEIVNRLPFRIQEEFQAFRDCLANLKPGELEGEYSQLFLTRMFCPPYETSHGRHGFNRAGTLADISGFYKAFGFSVSGTDSEMPDHIAIETEFMGLLAVKEVYGLEKGISDLAVVCASAGRSFLRDHLGSWAAGFCENLGRKTSSDFYRNLALLASRFIDEEIVRHGIEVEPAGEPNEERLEPMVCPVAEAEGTTKEAIL